MILDHLIWSDVDSDRDMFSYVGLTNLPDTSNGLNDHHTDKEKCWKK